MFSTATGVMSRTPNNLSPGHTHTTHLTKSNSDLRTDDDGSPQRFQMEDMIRIQSELRGDMEDDDLVEDYEEEQMIRYLETKVKSMWQEMGIINK